MQVFSPTNVDLWAESPSSITAPEVDQLSKSHLIFLCIAYPLYITIKSPYGLKHVVLYFKGKDSQYLSSTDLWPTALIKLSKTSKKSIHTPLTSISTNSGINNFPM